MCRQARLSCAQHSICNIRAYYPGRKNAGHGGQRHSASADMLRFGKDRRRFFSRAPWTLPGKAPSGTHGCAEDGFLQSKKGGDLLRPVQRRPGTPSAHKNGKLRLHTKKGGLRHSGEALLFLSRPFNSGRRSVLRTSRHACWSAATRR